MNKKTYKKFFQISILIALFLISGIVSSVGSNLPITQLAVSQAKDGGLALNKMVVGNLDSPQKLARITSSGWLGLGLPVSGTLTNPQVALDVRGTIRLSELSEPGVKVCANKDGDIVRCGFVEFTYGENCFGSCNQAVTTHKFTVPASVTSMTVELWGAGGMGYFQNAPSLYSRSPDNNSSCLQGNYQYADTYHCASGGSSYLYDTDGSTVLARAYGGEAPSSASIGGAGGSTNIPSNSKVTTITSGSGSTGDVGESGASASTISIVCKDLGNNNTYYLRDGKVGGKGGAGGSNGSGGATIFGPNGGFSGVSSDCSNTNAPNSGIPFKGVDGINAIRGSGGSGASGHGGSAYSDLYSGVCANNNCLSAQKGYPGGGGGGYVKIEVDVESGETYTLKLSHGGDNASSYVPSVSGLMCDYMSKNFCAQDVKSGQGGPGFARISY